MKQSMADYPRMAFWLTYFAAALLALFLLGRGIARADDALEPSGFELPPVVNSGCLEQYYYCYRGLVSLYAESSAIALVLNYLGVARAQLECPAPHKQFEYIPYDDCESLFRIDYSNKCNIWMGAGQQGQLDCQEHLGACGYTRLMSHMVISWQYSQLKQKIDEVIR